MLVLALVARGGLPAVDPDDAASWSRVNVVLIIVLARWGGGPVDPPEQSSTRRLPEYSLGADTGLPRSSITKRSAEGRLPRRSRGGRGGGGSISCST